MGADFCVEALQEALANYSAPEIFNADQGSQFTSEPFTAVLKTHDIRISMDRCRRCYDNIFVERLWRTVKYECVYLNAFDDTRAPRAALHQYFDWYNRERPHQALGSRSPSDAYFATRRNQLAA